MNTRLNVWITIFAHNCDVLDQNLDNRVLRGIDTIAIGYRMFKDYIKPFSDIQKVQNIELN